MLADAKQVRHLPGRPKRDPSDSRWLAACFERGAVTSCFVATPEFRLIREHTRYRRDLTGERTREKQRAEKLLESAAIKLSSVVTDLHGVTGRDVMDHLIAGERNPKVLAQLAGPGPAARSPSWKPRWRARSSSHRARRAAGHDARPHRPAHRRYRRADRGDRAAAGRTRNSCGRPGRCGWERRAPGRLAETGRT